MPLESKLLDRQRVQKWLGFRELPSERFTDGLVFAIGCAYLELAADGRTTVGPVIAGSAITKITDTINDTAGVFIKDYFERVGSVYR